jgi:ribosomal protein S27AE
MEKQATLWRNRQHCGETGYIVEKQATWRNRQHCGETGNIVHKTMNED